VVALAVAAGCSAERAALAGDDADSQARCEAWVAAAEWGEVELGGERRAAAAALRSVPAGPPEQRLHDLLFDYDLCREAADLGVVDLDGALSVLGMRLLDRCSDHAFAGSSSGSRPEAGAAAELETRELELQRELERRLYEWWEQDFGSGRAARELARYRADERARRETCLAIDQAIETLDPSARGYEAPLMKGGAQSRGETDPSVLADVASSRQENPVGDGMRRGSLRSGLAKEETAEGSG
jgi:hypothetical protein